MRKYDFLVQMDYVVRILLQAPGVAKIGPIVLEGWGLKQFGEKNWPDAVVDHRIFHGAFVADKQGQARRNKIVVVLPAQELNMSCARGSSQRYC